MESASNSSDHAQFQSWPGLKEYSFWVVVEFLTLVEASVLFLFSLLIQESKAIDIIEIITKLESNLFI